MTPGEVHDRLAELLAELSRLAAEHKLLCGAAAPDKVAVGTARWKIAGTGRQRMDLLSDTVFPLLERRCTGPELAAVIAFRIACVAYRRRISDYVARWSTSAILAEWATYQREAEAFRQAVSGHVGREKRLLLPILRRLASEGEKAPAPLEVEAVQSVMA